MTPQVFQGALNNTATIIYSTFIRIFHSGDSMPIVQHRPGVLLTQQPLVGLLSQPVVWLINQPLVWLNNQPVVWLFLSLLAHTITKIIDS